MKHIAQINKSQFKCTIHISGHFVGRAVQNRAGVLQVVFLRNSGTLYQIAPINSTVTLNNRFPLKSNEHVSFFRELEYGVVNCGGNSVPLWESLDLKPYNDPFLYFLIIRK